jgi:Sortilin, neurotensin receptor 3, C-terminal
MTLSSGVPVRNEKSNVYLVARFVDQLQAYSYIYTSSQTLYRRRIRDAKCYIGQLDRPPPTIQKNCTCTEVDFEWYVALFREMPKHSTKWTVQRVQPHPEQRRRMRFSIQCPVFAQR